MFTVNYDALTKYIGSGNVGWNKEFCDECENRNIRKPYGDYEDGYRIYGFHANFEKGRFFCIHLCVARDDSAFIRLSTVSKVVTREMCEEAIRHTSEIMALLAENGFIIEQRDEG